MKKQITSNWKTVLEKVKDDIVDKIPIKTNSGTRRDSKNSLGNEIIIFNLLTNPQKYEFSYEGFKKIYKELHEKS